MSPYPLSRRRLSKARLLACQICGAVIPRSAVYAHLTIHAQDGRYMGVEPLSVVYRAATERTSR